MSADLIEGRNSLSLEDRRLETPLELCRLVDSLRQSSEKRIPLSQCPALLDKLTEGIRNDSPLFISFGGQRSSYIILPTIIQSCPRSYTMTMWVRIREGVNPSGDMTLFRCTTSHNESIEFIVKKVSPDGRWQCSIKVDAGNRANNEAAGRLFVPPGKWHLITIIHKCLPYPNSPSISVFVDGELEIDRDLAYPFGSAGIECSWTIGAGFNGDISSFALYPTDIEQIFLKYLTDAGPTYPGSNL
jgi:hypothetical protein